MNGVVKTDLPLGNGKAKVAQTRGLKHWVSNRDSGVSIEATVTVELTCGQSEKAIEVAAHRCGEIAQSLAERGTSDMDKHIHDFVEKAT